MKNISGRHDRKQASQKSEARIPSPLEFMKERRPYLFSDSQDISEVTIPKATLEMQLDTLTSRKQEAEFEYFARLLAEKEICPNLVPQTGPTGGGDGKVDTETYPVAEEISERWFVGDANAAKERWAFAISTKRDWKPKVRADVASIMSTGRDYKRIFFITSQYAKSNDKSDLEDSLSALSDIPVTILDRSWILEKVYSNNHLELALRALGIEGFPKNTRSVGPNDLVRESELKELDAQIADPVRYVGSKYMLAEDCLQSALFARGLERPRPEIDGRFGAAERFADEVGYDPQRLRIAYNRAWTAFFWYCDYTHYNSLYDQVETLSLNSTNAADIEYLFNLWNLLHWTVRDGQLSVESGQIEERGARLADALERIAKDSSRPNNAFDARTNLLLMRATQAAFARDERALEVIWRELRDVVTHSAKLGSYSIEHLHDILQELGRYLPESKEFDVLFDDLIAVIEQRRSEGEGGKGYLERGLQKLEKGLPYDAIRLLGRAETRLAKDEYHEDLIQALLGISLAYRQAGLLWAARNNVLFAAERILSQFQEHGEFEERLLVPLKWLIWTELQLGRLPHVLATLYLINAVTGHIKLTDEKRIDLAEGQTIQEAVLGILLLNASLDQLRELEQLPDLLERLHLESARMALLWALGHDDAIRSEGYFPPEEPLAALPDFFSQWNSQPAKADLPARPNLISGSDVVIRSVVLGCEFIVTATNDIASVCLAEGLLAVIESFLSTSLKMRVMPYRERFDIVVRLGSTNGKVPELRFEDKSSSTIAIITHSTSGALNKAPEVGVYANWMRDTLIAIVLKVMVIEDPKTWLKQIAGDEDGFSRAIMLSNIAIITENIYGTNPKLNLSSWSNAEDRCYKLRRKRTWQVDVDKSEDAVAGDSPVKKGEFKRDGSLPYNIPIPDVEKGKHSDRRIVSLIDIPLWDKAGWKGTAFIGFGSGSPPCLGFVFCDFESGKRIFEGWKAKIGSIDREEVLRIAIITGVDRSHPNDYAISISRDIEGIRPLGSHTHLLTVSRIHRMNVSDPRNLQRFLSHYMHARKFLLMPMEFVRESQPRFDTMLSILKTKIVIRCAWEIDEHDPDLVVIHADDDPVIPEGVEDVPVLRVLKRAREHVSY